MKKAKKTSENYLKRKPARVEDIEWSKNDDNIVTLDIENKGFFNKFAQRLLKKPRVTHIHLDEFGSFVWCKMDGEMDIIAIGKLVEAEFGDKAKPLYERLAKYFQILDSYHFVIWK